MDLNSDLEKLVELTRRQANLKFTLNQQSFTSSANFNEQLRQAEDPTTPVNILENLAIQQDQLLRTRIALNPATPTYVLQFLALSNNSYILKSLCKNKNFFNPETISRSFNYFTGDKEGQYALAEIVMNHAKNNSAILKIVVLLNSSTLNQELAEDCDIDSEVLDCITEVTIKNEGNILSQRGRNTILNYLANNSNISATALFLIADTDHPKTVAAAKRHPNFDLNKFFEEFTK